MASLWNDLTIPANHDGVSATGLELGVVFTSSDDGFITAIRFWKEAGTTTDYRLSLWDMGGTLLARVTRPGDSASGWQQVSLGTPIAVTATTHYVVSYYSDPLTSYGFNGSYFAAAAFSNPPLTALQDGTDGGNGRFNGDPAGGFPTSTFNSTNYWADVVFVTSLPSSGGIGSRFDDWF